MIDGKQALSEQIPRTRLLHTRSATGTVSALLCDLCGRMRCDQYASPDLASPTATDKLRDHKFRPIQGEPHMPAKTANVCLLGTKFMGRAHANAYLKVPKFFTNLPLQPNMHTVVGR